MKSEYNELQNSNFFFPFPLWLILKSSDHIRTVNSLI